MDIPTDAVWYFHHIPKCAGSSIERAMEHAVPVFATRVVRDDGIRGPFREWPRPGSVLTGHWPAEGGPWKRYPQLAVDPKHHRLFTVVRDPWEARISLYWYHRKWGYIPSDSDIVDYMLSDPPLMDRIRLYKKDARPNRFWYSQRPRVVNYLAYYFGCRNQSDCRRVLDRYTYIGAVGLSDAPNPLAPLAILKTGRRDLRLEMRRDNVRTIGVSVPGMGYVDAMNRVEGDPSVRQRFRDLNALDEWIYAECVRRYRRDWYTLMASG